MKEYLANEIKLVNEKFIKNLGEMDKKSLGGQR